uniref:Ketoacyl reductase n=1 Tax=Trieres chinensis TaxID=1514140 RepID=A0A7S2A1M5_TRICV|mmetsp:Transcript_37866/g.77239  ORF Transcript_37866/g.77239 Transcript_37866/m.77239 type:complete len:311 (+) Transcript_37866:52-984(+)
MGNSALRALLLAATALAPNRISSLVSPSSSAFVIAMSTSPLRLAGQRILVTGGGRGIGRAIALICAREGGRVAITSRTESELRETASLTSPEDEACDGSVEQESIMDTYVADVTKEEDVERMVTSIVDKWGGIDVLVNNAGGSQRKGPAETLSASDLRGLLDLNVVSVHIVTSAVLRLAMLPAKSGRIVNISSKAGKVGLPSNSFYCASKFALEGYAASLAEELRDSGIEVNTLSPGMVNTRSFPKPEGRKGVRTAESVGDGLFTLLEGGVTGHYLHADELDAVREAGLEDGAALKPIREEPFSVEAKRR